MFLKIFSLECFGIFFGFFGLGGGGIEFLSDVSTF
jgi:hypothetical protein